MTTVSTTKTLVSLIMAPLVMSLRAAGLRGRSSAAGIVFETKCEATMKRNLHETTELPLVHPGYVHELHKMIRERGLEQAPPSLCDECRRAGVDCLCGAIKKIESAGGAVLLPDDDIFDVPSVASKNCDFWRIPK